MLSGSLLSSYPNLMTMVVMVMVMVMMTMVVLSSAVCPSKLEEPHFLLYLEQSLAHMDYEFSWLCWFPS